MSTTFSGPLKTISRRKGRLGRLLAVCHAGLMLSACVSLPERHMPPLDGRLTQTSDHSVLLFVTREREMGQRSGLSPGQFSFARVVCQGDWVDPVNTIGLTVNAGPRGAYSQILYGSDFSFPRPEDAMSDPALIPPAAAALCEVAPRGSDQEIPCAIAKCIERECFYEAPLDCETLAVGENPLAGRWSQ